MPSLSRQETRESIFSWWSDRNPGGPTISIHAAAKPLMRLMYHQQALAFIKRTRDAPLSQVTLEIYSSYLAFQHVSPSTKSMLLGELRKRAESDDDACTVANSLTLYLVDELLRAPDTEVRASTCLMLGTLACNESTKETVLGMNRGIQLVTLLRDKNSTVIRSAAKAVYQLVTSPEGAQAAVEANVLDCMADLLKSSNTTVRERACDILGGLARHETTASAVLALNPCRQLVSLLRGGNLQVTESAAEALHWIALSAPGAQAAVDANVLDCMTELLGSPNTGVREWMCEILGQLARMELVVLGLEHCAQLRSLLRDANLEVTESAAEVLYWITQSPESALAFVDANVLDCVPELLTSPSLLVQRWACETLGRLACHQSTHRAVVSMNPCPQLVSLLHENNPEVVENAVYALRCITKSPKGTEAALSAHVIGCLRNLLASSNAKVLRSTCVMIESLAYHKGSMTIWACKDLEGLLRNKNLEVIESGLMALVVITTSPAGAQAAVDANMVDCVTYLVKSPYAKLWRCTSYTLGNLGHRGFLGVTREDIQDRVHT